MSSTATKHDQVVLLASATLRSVAIGLAGVLIALYLGRLGFRPGGIGAVLGAGLAGATVATLLVSAVGDGLSRRAWLIGLGVTSAAGAVALACLSSPLAIGVAAFLGMVNGMGRDRGAALVLEQAVLPSTTDDAGRTRAFAWYNLLQDFGHGVGGLLAALSAILRTWAIFDETTSFRAMMLAVAVLLAASAALYLGLSPAVDATPEVRRRASLSPESRRVVGKISALFFVDSLGGGFLATALIAYFLHQRFGVGEEVLGPLFFAARMANGLSHLGAAWLARRFGLVKTMVFTHIPSSLLLLTLPYAPSFLVAAGLFLLREALVEMDVPTRQSYVMAVVRPEERTTASGVTHLVRLAGWAVAPSVAGVLMQAVSLATPLIFGAGLKIVYDFLLYAAFRNLPPPEER